MRLRSTTASSLALAFALSCGAAAVAQETGPEPTPADTEVVKHFRIRSPLLSAFHGRDTFLEAGVVLPPERAADEQLPLCLTIHGFGGSHRGAWGWGPRLEKWIAAGSYPRMLYVYPNAQQGTGHHAFADSANNGPMGRALVEELVPALEKEFGAVGRPSARFVTGHSSGGWSALWLQTSYPDFFGGVWATAPDPVDFRAFTGADIYAYDSLFTDREGREVAVMRQGKGRSVTARQAMADPQSRLQIQSFEAVFSPRGENGRPRLLFDRETGRIDRDVAKAWRKYDIRHLLAERWQSLGAKLAGKLNIYVGAEDTFRLEAAVELLREQLEALGSDATFVIVDDRNHFDLIKPHEQHWPRGMITRIHREMWDRYRAGVDAGRSEQGRPEQGRSDKGR